MVLNVGLMDRALPLSTASAAMKVLVSSVEICISIAQEAEVLLLADVTDTSSWLTSARSTHLLWCSMLRQSSEAAAGFRSSSWARLHASDKSTGSRA